MKNLDFEWLTDEFMLYCRSTQLREKTMSTYEQTLHLFGRWLSDELQIYTVDTIARLMDAGKKFIAIVDDPAEQVAQAENDRRTRRAPTENMGIPFSVYLVEEA